MFARKGLDMARIDEIAELADVGKGTFYYHFGTREKLIKELIGDILVDLERLIDERCSGIADLEGLLDALVGAHISLFSNRWEDFVLYYQGTSDLVLEESYAGLQTPFLRYLEHVARLLAFAVRQPLPGAVLHRVACALAGFVTGYYSLATITSNEEDSDATFRSLRGATVAALARVVQDAVVSSETKRGG